MISEGAVKGILVTTAHYGRDAREFVKDKPISLIDGSNLVYLLEQHGHRVRIDIDEARLETARLIGATETRLIDQSITPASLCDLLPSGADVVFETSGVLGSAERAFALAARGGSVVLVGLNKAPQPLNLANIVLREVNVQTTVAHVCGSDLTAALALLDARPLSDVLLDRIVSLDDVIVAGLDPLVAGEVRGKILVGLGHG